MVGVLSGKMQFSTKHDVFDAPREFEGAGVGTDWLTSTSAQNDTIFAVSSAQNVRSAVCVIRVSGVRVLETLTGVLGERVVQRLGLEERKMVRARIREPKSGEELDDCLLVYFGSPRSYSGEDVLEIHCHGSVAVVDAIVDVLGSLDGVRAAEAGEFTRRAFLNGKLGLPEVEAIGDLLEAETPSQRRAALRNLDGRATAQLEEWRKGLLHSLAMVEAQLDFGDEEEDVGVLRDVVPVEVMEEMEKEVQKRNQAEACRDGVRVVIVGPPNAGKSSLLNRLVDREAAIVTDIPGTTRDIVSVRLNLKGVLVHISDTAGIRETQDTVEKIGVERAKSLAKQAHIRVGILDIHHLHSVIRSACQVPTSTILSTAIPLSLPLNSLQPQDIVLLNKTDLDNVQHEQLSQLVQSLLPPKVRALPVSVKTGYGIDQVLHHLATNAKSYTHDQHPDQMPLLTRARQYQHLQACLDHLHDCQRDLDRMPLDLVAEHLRLAARELGLLTGAIHTEEVLDVLFSSFCVGK